MGRKSKPPISKTSPKPLFEKITVFDFRFFDRFRCRHFSYTIGVTSPYLTLPYRTLPYLTLPYLTLPHLSLPYLTLPHLSLPYLIIPYHTLPFLTLPCHTLPHLTSPYLTVTYLTSPYLILPCLFSLNCAVCSLLCFCRTGCDR